MNQEVQEDVVVPQQNPGIRSDAVVQYLRTIAGALSSIVVDITSQVNQVEQSINNKETNND